MKLIIAAILLSIGIFADAQQIVKLTGKKEILKVENLKAHPDGSISYKFSGKEWKAPEFSYDYARIPKPKAILAADQVLKKGNFKKALKLYQIEYDKYKNLGWGVYCITGMAKAQDRDGNLKEALKQLERLKYYESPDPYLEKDFSDAKMLYTDLLIKAKDYKSALSVTESMLASKENSVVFFAFDRKGDIALLQKDKKKAVRNYLQAHFLIPEHPRKAEVLYKATVLLKELKDKRWQKFADLLKKQYPNSGYAGKL